MKTIKKLSTVVLLAALVVLVAASCKDDKKEKPAGFGLQGTWSTTTGEGGTTFVFSAMPTLTYTATTGSAVVEGAYEYSAVSDVLVLKPSTPDGAKAETYTVKWKDDKYTAFTFTGGTTYKDLTVSKK